MEWDADGSVEVVGEADAASMMHLSAVCDTEASVSTERGWSASDEV